MFGHTFYWGLIRKYVSYFGTCFNDIEITRTIKGGSEPSDLIKVPLTYAPKKRVLVRFDQDPGIDRPSAITLPRMAFEIAGSIQYDATRNLPGLNKFASLEPTDANKMKIMYVGCPINIPFNLYIYVKNTEDGTKIIEQILPFFKPEWTASVQLIPEHGITMDIPIVHVDTQIEDQYDGSFKERQILTYTLSFNMKAWLFGPEYKKPIIKFSNTNFYTTANDQVGAIKVTPGMDANGVATSNSLITVLPSEIYADDDFGYIIERTGNIFLE